MIAGNCEARVAAVTVLEVDAGRGEPCPYKSLSCGGSRLGVDVI
jgi:hypothetical protein